MPLSEHVYCVAIVFKMTEWVEQRICIKFYVKLELSSTETIQMIQKAAAMANWWLAASLWRVPLTHRISCRVFWQNVKSCSCLSPPTAQMWHPVTSGCSQNSNHLWKGRDFRPSVRFRKIRWGSWWWLGELCEGPRCLIWRGLRHHCLMYNVCCILYLLHKCLYFS